MWKLRFEVLDGEYRGRYIFDNMVFSDAALKRVKLICSRLGLDVSGEVELTPEVIMGRKCWVTVETEEYEDDDECFPCHPCRRKSPGWELGHGTGPAVKP